jgi:hypothetical protein
VATNLANAKKGRHDRNRTDGWHTLHLNLDAGAPQYLSVLPNV